MPLKVSSLLVFLIVFCACNSQELPEEPKNTNRLDKNSVDKSTRQIDTDFTPISFNDYKINEFKHRMDLSDFVFYGSFYDNGVLKIYRLKNLYKLKELDYMFGVFLYFIDDVLLRKQAYLFDNQAKQFMTDFGKAKLVLRSDEMRQIYENHVSTKGNSLVSFLYSGNGFYELNWEMEEELVKFYVNETDDQITSADNLIKSKDYFGAPYKLDIQSKEYKNLIRILNYSIQ